MHSTTKRRFLVFGASCWIGRQFIAYANDEIDDFQFILTETSAHDLDGVREELGKYHKPDSEIDGVVCFVGKSGEPTHIDGILQSKPSSTALRDNLFALVALALLCERQHKYLVHFGVDCLFNLSNSTCHQHTSEIQECDVCDSSDGTAVSTFTNRFMQLFDTGMLRVRIGLTAGDVLYRNVLMDNSDTSPHSTDVPDSVTILSTVWQTLTDLMRKEVCGIVNL
jgi:hypothetical protein